MQCRMIITMHELLAGRKKNIEISQVIKKRAIDASNLLHNEHSSLIEYTKYQHKKLLQNVS